MEEKRKNKRIPITLDIQIILSTGEKYKGKTINLSFGGVMARFQENVAIKPESLCKMILLLEAGEEYIELNFKAKAVHIKENILGFSFLYIIDLDGYKHFKNLMVFNSDDPDELLNELEEHPGMLIDKGNKL